MDQGVADYAPDGALAWWGGTPQLGGIVLLEAGGVPKTLAGFGDPVWSPDGQFIVTQELNATGGAATGHLVIIDRDGKIVTSVEDAGDWFDWQPLPG